MHAAAAIQPQRFDHWKDARLATLQHSFAQQHLCVFDSKASSGRKRVYVCSSCKPASAEKSVCSVCPYKIVWNKRVKRDQTWWINNVAQSCYDHSLDCPSEQVMRTEQLCADINFKKHIVNDKTSTLENLKEFATGPGVVANGVKSHNLYRAKHQILRQNARFYKDDFCKLKAWCRELERKNPGTVWHVDVDDAGRSLMHRIVL